MTKLLWFGALALAALSVTPIAMAAPSYVNDRANSRVIMHVPNEDFGNVWWIARSYVPDYRAQAAQYGYSYDQRSDASIAGEMRAHVIGNWLGRPDNDFGISPRTTQRYESAYPLLGWW